MQSLLPFFGWLTVFVGLATLVHSQPSDRPKRYTILDIQIGDMAPSIPDEFVHYACGTSGGPPSILLTRFTDFTKCKADSSGLHEVYFEYDDELEYEARAVGDVARIRMYAGTTLFEFPIVASVLFDDTGRVRGKRMVTDPRQQVSRDRLEFWELANFIRLNFGDDPWTCKDLPPHDGESPAGTRFLKNHCEKTVAGTHLIFEQHFFQKKGQTFEDPRTGKAQPDAFESATRFEIYDARVALK
jgi:hypothetical protein